MAAAPSCPRRRGLLPGPRAGTWPSVPSRQACSYSAGGRPPVRRMTRAVLYPPAPPFAGGRLDLGGGFPWPQVSDSLGLVQPDDRLRQRVVVGVPDAADRRRDASFRQLGAGSVDRYSLPASLLSRGTPQQAPPDQASARIPRLNANLGIIAVVDQPGHPPPPAGPGRSTAITSASSTRPVLWLAAVRHPAISRENASITSAV